MKVIKRTIKYFFIGVIIGFFIAFLNYNPAGKHLINSIVSVKWYYHILIFLLMLIVNIAVHELGHLIVARINKLNVKAIFIFIFIFYRDKNKKLKFKIELSLAKLLGGLVIITSPKINNEDEKSDYINKLIKATKAGPVFSISFFGITFLVTSLFMLLNNFILSGVFINILGSTFIYTILIVLSSNVSYKGLYGDFVLEKLLKDNKLLQLSFIISNNENKDITPYVFSLLKEEILTHHRGINNIHYQNILIAYLDEILKDVNKFDFRIDQLIQYSPKYFRKDENGYILSTNLYLYYYQTRNTPREEEYLIYLENNNFDIKKEVKEFWDKYRTALVNNDQNTLLEIESSSNYTPSSTSWITNVINYDRQITKQVARLDKETLIISIIDSNEN